MIYRIKFEKRDEVKYIGHLDTMRTFIRCIKKTDLPIKFSGGFNPRVQINFALPLAVGVTSECEYFDLELNGEVEANEIISKLTKVLPEGFKIKSAEEEKSSKGLMALVSEAIYEITLIINNISVDEANEKINNILSKDEIITRKQTKNGKEEEINLKSYIIDSKAEACEYNIVKVTCHSFAGSKNNLNPNLLTKVFIDELGLENVEDYNIHRKELILS